MYRKFSNDDEKRNLKWDRRIDDICISIRSSRSGFVASVLPRSLIKLESRENQCITVCLRRNKGERGPRIGNAFRHAIKCTGRSLNGGRSSWKMVIESSAAEIPQDMYQMNKFTYT